MNKSRAALLRERDNLLQRFRRLDSFIDGSLFIRNLNGKQRVYLSRMGGARSQRQHYISAHCFGCVSEGVQQYRELKTLVRAISEINLKIAQLPLQGGQRQ